MNRGHVSNLSHADADSSRLNLCLSNMVNENKYQ